MDRIINNIRSILYEYIDEVVDEQVNRLNINKFSKENLKDILFELLIEYVNINNIVSDYCVHVSIYLTDFDDSIYYNEFERVCRQLISVFVNK